MATEEEWEVVLKSLSWPNCVCLHPWLSPRAPATYSRSNFHFDIFKQATLKLGDALGNGSSDMWNFSLMQEMMSFPPASHQSQCRGDSNAQREQVQQLRQLMAGPSRCCPRGWENQPHKRHLHVFSPASLALSR